MLEKVLKPLTSILSPEGEEDAQRQVRAPAQRLSFIYETATCESIDG